MDFERELIERLNENRLYQTLGLRVTDTGPGFAVSRMSAPEPLCWPRVGQPHGGIVFTQVDTTMATAVMTLLEPVQRCATVSVDIQYPSPAEGPYLQCEARTTHRGRRMVFVQAETRAPDNRLVVLAQASFRVFSHHHGVDLV